MLAAMAAVRRTVSLPPAVAAWLDTEAERCGTSISSVVTEVVDRQLAALPYAGLIADDDDLSLKFEQVLARLGE
jgi:hypothetical protein